MKRVFAATILAAVVISCGGASFDDGDGDGGSGAGTAGGGNAGQSGKGGASGAGAVGGGSPDLDACETPFDCTLVSTHCCAPCQGELRDFVAINVAHRQEFFDSRSCGPIACEPCPAPDPTADYQRYFIATCAGAGQCVPVDLRSVGAVDCDTDADCHLRNGTACCEECAENESSLVVYNLSSWLEDLACGTESTGCPDCAPQHPAEFVALCQAGLCELRRSAMP
jgi:hypothetical protein